METTELTTVTSMASAAGSAVHLHLAADYAGDLGLATSAYATVIEVSAAGILATVDSNRAKGEPEESLTLFLPWAAIRAVRF